MREFQISGPVWGRYEVWKDWPSDHDPVRLAWRQQFRCLDVSEARGESTGLVWKLICIGYVYRRVDPAVAFATDPNQVLGRETLEVEVRRISLSPPGQAALCACFALGFNLFVLHHLTRRALLRHEERARGYSPGFGLYPAAVLGAGGVTFKVPEDVIGPPVKENPYEPDPLTLVTVPPADAALIMCVLRDPYALRITHYAVARPHDQ